MKLIIAPSAMTAVQTQIVQWAGLVLLKALWILGIIVAAILIWKFSKRCMEIYLTKRGEDITLEQGRAHTLIVVTRKAIFVALLVIASLMVLSELGLSIGPLLAGAGVLGLAVSFGAQKLVQDVITGFFILLENQIAMGDMIVIGNLSGCVEAISIRTVRLRDLNGAVHIVPYSSIVTISNLAKDYSFYVLNIGVAYRENIDAVITVLRQIGEDMQRDPGYNSLILEPLDVLGLDQFADSAIMIKARLKTQPMMQWRVGREFNRRMKQKFDEAGISIPFPHTVVLLEGR